MSINDGGPAFPMQSGISADGITKMDSSGGMSLRDHFAGQAMMGWIANSLLAHRQLRPAVLRRRITDILSAGIPYTARELAAMLKAPLVTVRARLSVGSMCDDEGPVIFRKAVRVNEPESRTPVWAYALAEVPAVVGAE